MAALVEHDFERGFELDEERLRKIHDLIDSRISKYPTPLSLRYKVSRGDSLSYETGSVQDVVNEDNDDWRAITRLELFAEGEVFKFRLAFARETVSLLIAGTDRDAVFLLFSDLREYVRNEVLAGRKIDKPTARLAGMSVALLALLAFMFYMFRSIRVDPAIASAALSSTDLAEKLNFLIRDRLSGQSAVSWMPWVFALFFLAIVFSGAVARLWNAVFPSSVFLFGRRKAQFERRRRLLGNIFWVVIVGLAVSAVAGILVWRVTSK